MTSAELREMLSQFPKAPLALNPTPLHPLKRMQAELDCGPLFIKRDDLNGMGIGGNKVRNLEYLKRTDNDKRHFFLLVPNRILTWQKEYQKNFAQHKLLHGRYGLAYRSAKRQYV